MTATGGCTHDAFIPLRQAAFPAMDADKTARTSDSIYIELPNEGSLVCGGNGNPARWVA